MQKTVNAETKIGLRFSIIVLYINFWYFIGYYLFYNIFIKIQTQEIIIKDFFFKKVKATKSKSIVWPKIDKFLNKL